ncbi:MAG: hypothetical protein KJ017_05995 [Alphaproteobacteria bacterium]|nr:hypothetical protein [Alphaproteobacteria bacterium]
MYPHSREILKPILFGRDVRRYFVPSADRFVIYCHPNVETCRYPAIERHLAPLRQRLTKRAGPQQWFELQQPATALLPIVERPKIVYPIIANQCRFVIDEDGYLVNDKMFVLPLADSALVAVLKSRVANFYFVSVCAALEGSRDRYLEFRAQYVDPFPIPLEIEKASSELASLANQVHQLYKRRARAKIYHERTALQRQIDATDREIDRLVYELYGLTEKEIRIVADATAVETPAAT